MTFDLSHSKVPIQSNRSKFKATRVKCCFSAKMSAIRKTSSTEESKPELETKYVTL